MIVLYKKGKKDFESFRIYVCLVLCTSLNIYMFIVMHELRGSFYKAYL